MLQQTTSIMKFPFYIIEKKIIQLISVPRIKDTKKLMYENINWNNQKIAIYFAKISNTSSFFILFFEHIVTNIYSVSAPGQKKSNFYEKKKIMKFY